MTKQQLLRMAEFDHTKMTWRELGAPTNLPDQRIGAAKENARLLPLITALVESREEMREALEFYAEQERKDNLSGQWILTPASIEALAADDARMNELNTKKENK